ncbi:aldo/keto reductase [Moorena producens JHB]|uniref:Aldo/keto reductase n=1 Tax=Moorena producens (strain JHB) TaxID=1454205 RepID=A0A1D9G9B1_MOOP1|nr:aldo/keto reductase [Moorena producens]AOY84114.1 aldo/keto reductase [Moorena producens JHB]
MSVNNYYTLGRSGLRVSRLALGTMTFGTEWGWGADRTTAKTLFDDYVEAGGNFIDTADLYTNGTSETWLGEFMGTPTSQNPAFSNRVRIYRKNSGANERRQV